MAMRSTMVLTVACVVALALCRASSSVPESYKDHLIAHYPYHIAAAGEMAPVYPALAQQIVEDYRISEGVCVDVGGGSGMLSTELARITNLTCYVLDIDPYAVRLCNLLAEESDLIGRVRGVEGDAMDLPFKDGFADLVVSRGSIFFWPDQLRGVLEAYRILKPGGVAFIGGGFSRILESAIRTPLAEAKRRDFVEGRNRAGWRALEDDLVPRAQESGIARISLIEEPIAGWWLEIRK